MTAVARSETFFSATTTALDPSSVPDGRPLLPDPSPSLAGGMDDAMGCIYAVLSQERALDLQSGEQGVSENKTLEDAALVDEQAALKRQEANEAGSGRGFFSSIGHLISNVAVDLAQGEIGRATSDAESDLRDAWNSPKFWSDIATGLNAVADVAGGVADVAKVVPVAGTAVAAAADTVDAVATVGAALAKARGGYFAAEVVDARADATAAKDDVDSLQTTADWMLDDMKATDESQGRALDDVRGAIEINDRTLLVSASVTVRG
ncbi:MAG: hypothetical protein ACLP1X_17480 [Polyangiaceae bacterium]